MIQIERFEAFKFDLKTRMPFRYGIAVMTELPHVLVRLTVRIDGGPPVSGWAGDHLPPKWFKKDPDQDPHDEIEEMLSTIRRAGKAAVGCRVENAFHWWLPAYKEQLNWGQSEALPPLLAHFGLTLVERALLHAVACEAGLSFHHALKRGYFGFSQVAFADLLANPGTPPWETREPLSHCQVRHTVGLSDPIFESEVDLESPQAGDGLPVSLERVIAAYGVSHFKIKISGDPETDLARLDAIESCIRQAGLERFWFSLDGNEQFQSMDAFSDCWDRLLADCRLFQAGGQCLWIEQPVHRNQAFNPGSGRADRLLGNPPVIIDESDAELESLGRALDLGYAGTSHKNCKGVFKGLHHACLLAGYPVPENRPAVLSGEDLSTIGPVSLLQDLAVLAVLGISSVERNGHHYFRGLSAFPESINRAILEAHPDLYIPSPEAEFARVSISEGALSLESVNRSPFGLAMKIDPPVENRLLDYS